MAETVLPDELERPQTPPSNQTLFTRIIDVMAALGTIATFALMFLVVADVAGRDLFKAPIKGVAEIAGQAIICIVFLQLASAINAGRMTRADFLLDILGGQRAKIVQILELVFALLGALAIGIMAYAAIRPLEDAWTGNEFFGVQGYFTFPTWPTHVLVFMGSVMATLAFLRLALLKLRSVARS